MEIWKRVDGQEFYEVSNLGRVRSLPRVITRKDGYATSIKGHTLRASYSKNGYLVVAFPGGVKKTVHRLVAEHFLPVPESTFHVTVNHRDGNKLNNQADNLEWATHERNNAHAREIGLCKQRGENTNLSKWSDQCVEAVKRLKANGKLTQKEIAHCLGVSEMFVSQVVRGQTRKLPTD